MGPDVLDRQSIWYMFCCNFICLHYQILPINIVYRKKSPCAKKYALLSFFKKVLSN